MVLRILSPEVGPRHDRDSRVVAGGSRQRGKKPLTFTGSRPRIDDRWHEQVQRYTALNVMLCWEKPLSVLQLAWVPA